MLHQVVNVDGFVESLGPSSANWKELARQELLGHDVLVL